MAVGRGSLGPPWHLKFSVKKVAFLVVSPLLPPSPLEKSSVAHASLKVLLRL